MVRLTKCLVLVASLALGAALCGCGSTTYPSVNGTWTLAAISSVLLSEPPQSITGTLASSGSSVTGTLTFSNSCFKNQPLAYSGSIGDSNALKLTSATYNNQVVTLNGTLSTDGSLLTSGSYTVTPSNISQGICDTGDTGSLSGSR
jgi:hypothetical protein